MHYYVCLLQHEFNCLERICTFTSTIYGMSRQALCIYGAIAACKRHMPCMRVTWQNQAELCHPDVYSLAINGILGRVYRGYTNKICRLTRSMGVAVQTWSTVIINGRGSLYVMNCAHWVQLHMCSMLNPSESVVYLGLAGLGSHHLYTCMFAVHVLVA